MYHEVQGCASSTSGDSLPELPRSTRTSSRTLYWPGKSRLSINGAEKLTGRFEIADPPGLSGWNRLVNQIGLVVVRAGIEPADHP